MLADYWVFLANWFLTVKIKFLMITSMESRILSRYDFLWVGYTVAVDYEKSSRSTTL